MESLWEKIKENFYVNEKTGNADFKLPTSGSKTVLDKTFYYRPKMYDDYLHPFLEQYYADNSPVSNELKSINGNKSDLFRCLKCTQTPEFKKGIEDFHKYVLPLCSQGVKGLPLYFSPRPLRSAAVQVATSRHPLTTILHHPNPRPSAEKATSVKDLVTRAKKVESAEPETETKWYASVKFDGHAGIWTGRGLITKDGKSILKWVPPTLKRELLKHFKDDVLLGEIVLVKTEAEVINTTRYRLGLITDKTLGDAKMYNKDNISTLYSEFQDSKDNSGEIKAVKKAARMMFFVYDIISYKHRNKKFKERYDILTKLQETKKFKRIMIVEQFELGSMIEEIRPKKQWNYPLQPETVLEPNSAITTEGVHQVNTMLLGCITHNQEGIFVKADRPYYDQFNDIYRPIKLKARMEFAVKVNEADTKVERLEDRNLKFKSKPFVYLPPDIIQSTPADDEVTEELRQREIGKPKLEFKVEGKTQYRDTEFVTLTNMFSFLGAQIGPPPKEAPRRLAQLLPEGVGNLAENTYQYLLREKVISEAEDLEYEEYREATQLVQLGNALDFRDYPVVVSDTKAKMFEEEEPVPEKRGITLEYLSKLEPKYRFPDEPDNETLFQILFALPNDVDRGNQSSYNRWIPALRRFVEGNASGFKTIVLQKGLSPAGPRMKQVDQTNVSFIPKAVPLFYRESDSSNTFIKLEERSKIPSGITKLFVDLKRLVPRQVFITTNVDTAETKPSMSITAVLKDPENKKYDEESLSQIEVPELQSVQNGGLVEYNGTKITNSAAVIYYLQLVNEYMTIDNFEPGNFNFS